MPEANCHTGDIIIRFYTQEEALALYHMLSGNAQSLDQVSADFANWLYGWFFESVKKIALEFDKEVPNPATRGLFPKSYVPPNQGVRRTLK